MNIFAKNKLRFIVLQVLLLLALLFSVGCRKPSTSVPPKPQSESVSVSSQPSFPTPEQNLDEAFSALKNGDFEQLQTYIFSDGAPVELNDGFDLTMMEQYDIDPEMLSDATDIITNSLYQHLDYEVLDSEIISDKARLTVSLTTPDGEALIETFINEFATLYAKNLFSGGSNPEELAGEVILSMLENLDTLCERKTTTQTVINMVKGEEHWLIEADEELLDAITGGSISAAGELAKFADTLLPMTKQFNDINQAA